MKPANKGKEYIPVLKPSITEEEIASVVETMRSGWIGLGPKTEEFEKKFAQKVGARFCVGLNSCTAALHLAMASLNLSQGDEVIVTPMTFVSTVHAVVYTGATPVFADIQPDTLNIDPEDVSTKITPRTKAIIGVDMAGHPVDLDELTNLAEANGLTLVEDAAHACGAIYKGRPVGSRPHFTCFSFHAVKNLTCGEGGAITCEHEWQDRWFREMRWLGISKDTWERTVEDLTYKWKYSVNRIGYKCHMNDLAAAIGLVQLKRLDELNKTRREIAGRYRKGLSGLEWLTLPTERSYVQSSWHLFQVRLPEERTRDRFITHLTNNGIAPGVHYIPAFVHPCYRQYKAACPVAATVWKQLVTLPLYPDLLPAEQEKIINTIRSFRP